VLLVVGLVAFVGVAFAAKSILGLNEPVHMSVPLALVLSAVPALLWLGYFYLQDRHEPEPKHYVAGVYLLGAFGAARLAQFLQVDLLPTTERDLAGVGVSFDMILRAVLVVGLAQEFAKFVVVRYTIYLSDEFDEPMDGIIYMTAAGIGFATAQNIEYFASVGGVYLNIGAINAVITTMAHACFAGVLGYALGRAKFATSAGLTRNFVLLAGLVVAAVLNGVFHVLEQKVVASGLSVEPWRGLAFASGFAVIVFIGTSMLMQRNLSISPHKA